MFYFKTTYRMAHLQFYISSIDTFDLLYVHINLLPVQRKFFLQFKIYFKTRPKHCVYIIFFFLSINHLFKSKLLLLVK